MASTDVQVEDGYTRIANRLLTAIALAPWDTPSQASVVLALVRVTYGLQRRDAGVGYSEWRKLTGLSDATLSRALVSLQQNGVLRCVREQDSKTHRPRVWRLEKRWTYWQRFRVSTEDLDVAEAVATQRLREIPPPVDDPGVTGEEGSPMTPGSPATPDPGSSMTRGHELRPYSPNGLRPPKERKERRTPSLSFSPKPETAGGRAAAAFCERVGVGWSLRKRTPDEWAGDLAFPHIDIPAEIRAAADWYEEALVSGKKKGCRSPASFLLNWLKRAEASAPKVPNGKPKPRLHLTAAEVREQYGRPDDVPLPW